MNQKIEVIGAGCPTCKKFYELVKEVASEIDPKITVEYSDDISKIIAMGIMSIPVLIVNDEAVIKGSTSDVLKIKDAIIKGEASEEDTGCSCGSC